MRDHKANTLANYRRVAFYAARILNGTKPQDGDGYLLRHFHNNKLQSRHILEVLCVRSEHREIALNRLRREPQILNSEIGACMVIAWMSAALSLPRSAAIHRLVSIRKPTDCAVR